MKVALWLALAMAVMAGVLGGFWYGMVHAKSPAAGVAGGTAGASAAAPGSRAAGVDLVSGMMSDLETSRLAAVACGEALAGKQPRCGVCPAGSDDGGEKGARADGPAGGWTPDSAVEGHFTGIEAEEALLRTSGCESDAATFGGDFLLRRDAAGGWQRVRYIQGGEASGRCKTLRWPQAGTTLAGGAGRDALVCEVGSMHQGIQSDSVWLITVGDQAVVPGDGSHTSFVTVNDDSADCPPGGERHVEQEGGIDKINLLPAGADGRQDVEVLLSLGRARLPAKLKPGDDCPAVKKKQYRLVFRHAGDHFEAGDGYAEMKALAQSGEEGDITVEQRVIPFAY